MCAVAPFIGVNFRRYDDRFHRMNWNEIELKFEMQKRDRENGANYFKDASFALHEIDFPKYYVRTYNVTL